AVVPGLDGQKMSKSYDNTIDPFQPEKKLRKRIMKIVTDSTPVEDPKDPEADTTFQIFTALAGRDDPRTKDLEKRYREGGMGYGEAKQALFELVMDHFGQARQRREELLKNPDYVDQVLQQGAAAAREKVLDVTTRARAAAGL
ncbi:MAG: tryptophan--tRNA ligase, partial [Phycisphaeraceae bacterium]